MNYPYRQQQMAYPQMNRPTYVEQPNYPGIKGRPVSSIEEVKASIIDFDGSIFYFPDSTNQRIYTKQINVDGTCTINVYEKTAMPVADFSSPDSEPLVSKKEFDETIAKIMERFETLVPAKAAKPFKEVF